MNCKRRIHDGIVGLIVIGGIAAGMYINIQWLWLPAVLGIVLLQSAVTGFCPVYYLLDKKCSPDASNP